METQNCTETSCSLGSFKEMDKEFWAFWKNKSLKYMPDYEHPRYCPGIFSDDPTSKDLSNLCKIARRFSKEYDVGIGIARGGMLLSHILNQHGLPMLIVKQSRKYAFENNGEATWEPLDQITEKQIFGKKVLVTDEDVMEGSTFRRVAREICPYRPAALDAFLLLGPERRDFRDSKFVIADMRKVIPQAFGKAYFYGELIGKPVNELYLDEKGKLK
jgi:hypothetical protein